MRKICAVLLLSIVFFGGCVEKSDETMPIKRQEDSTARGTQVNLPVFTDTYSYIERNITTEDFSFIKKGMSVQAVKDVLGESNGLCGSGMLRDYYVLSDHSVVIVIEDKNGVHALQQRKFDKEGNILKKWILAP